MRRPWALCYFQKLWDGIFASFPSFHWRQLEWHYEGETFKQLSKIIPYSYFSDLEVETFCLNTPDPGIIDSTPVTAGK